MQRSTQPSKGQTWADLALASFCSGSNSLPDSSKTEGCVLLTLDVLFNRGLKRALPVGKEPGGIFSTSPHFNWKEGWDSPTKHATFEQQ